MVEALKPEDISFAAILVHGVDAQENVKSVRPKIVRINWVGTAVKPMKKMGALAGKSKMAEIWQGSAADMDANESADVSMASIGTVLLKAGAAHKPTHYECGEDSIKISDITV